ncbi:MAG: hypothetical protein AAFY71_19015 [Bacteroidota bacterium]
MSKVRLVALAFASLNIGLCLGQPVERVKKLPSEGNPSHMYVNVEIPAGECMVKSSGNCGVSLAKLSAPDSAIEPSVMTHTDQHGNQSRSLNLKNTHQSPSAPQGAHLRTQQHLVSLDSYTSKNELKTEYHHDPNLSTDLALQLGVGQAKMDLSGLTLRNLSVRSAFTDVFVTYRMPNQIAMKKMDIHAARANVVMENIEKARVELVYVKNDMGETRLTLGDGKAHKSTIYVQSGVGNCTLVVNENQPVIIVLKKGLFSKLDNQGNFKQLQDQKDVYVNEAYHRNPEKASKIICSLDLGDITLYQN